MTFGLSSVVFTTLHVGVSLLAIAFGAVVAFGLVANKRLPASTAIFFATTAATSVTGFLFPFHGITPAIGVGVLSVILLAAAIVAHYGRHLRGPWRWIYVVGVVAALYLNCFVLVVQSFLKVPALHALAPTGSGPVFALAQAVVLAGAVIVGILALRRFHPVPH